MLLLPSLMLVVVRVSAEIESSRTVVVVLAQTQRPTRVQPATTSIDQTLASSSWSWSLSWTVSQTSHAQARVSCACRVDRRCSLREGVRRITSADRAKQPRPARAQSRTHACPCCDSQDRAADPDPDPDPDRRADQRVSHRTSMPRGPCGVRVGKEQSWVASPHAPHQHQHQHRARHSRFDRRTCAFQTCIDRMLSQSQPLASFLACSAVWGTRAGLCADAEMAEPEPEPGLARADLDPQRRARDRSSRGHARVQGRSQRAQVERNSDLNETA